MSESKFIQIATNKRTIIVVIAMIIALIAISPKIGQDAVIVVGVDRASPAADAGVGDATDERIIAFAGKRVTNEASFYEAVEGLKPGIQVLETNKGLYRLNIEELFEGNESIGITDHGIRVDKAPATRLKAGLDLRGGTRVLLEPEDTLSQDDMSLLIGNLENRLNVFGLSDVVVRQASDLSGKQFVLVEIAGVTEQEVRDLVSRQGKFEAVLDNQTVFSGSEIVHVGRSPTDSGIAIHEGGCRDGGSQWVCPFFFSITLNPEATTRHADVSREIPVEGGYLTEQLHLYLDDELFDVLNVGESLRGREINTFQISGAGSGASERLAREQALAEMKQLQTILITGSLPTEISVAQTDTISPALGSNFVRNALLTGLSAILAVMIILFIAYRRVTIAIPIMITTIIETYLLLGVAAMIGWSIDLAGIAGIIAAVGTGVNDQIIITDEALRGHSRQLQSWKDKLQSAFSVIMGAYLTLLVAMLPLFFIGAGLLRGFAVTTIIGITVGVFVTRPAYAKIVEILTEKKTLE